MQYANKRVHNNHWITARIKTSCKHKRFFTLLERQPTVLKLKCITIQTEFKLSNKNISTKQSAEIINNQILNCVDELITQQLNNESGKFSLRESFLHEFPQNINIPVTQTEVIRTVSSLKDTTSCGCDSLSNKILKMRGSQISKPITYIYNKSLPCGICSNYLKYAIIKACF